MLKLNLQYFGHLVQRADSLEKTLMLERLKAKGEGSDGGCDGWIDHGLNGHEFEQILGDGEGQESLVCTWYMCTWCTWGHKVGHNLAIEEQQFSKRLHLSYNRLSRPRDRLTSKLKLNENAS